jgi:hypothetical protein
MAHKTNERLLSAAVEFDTSSRIPCQTRDGRSTGPPVSGTLVPPNRPSGGRVGEGIAPPAPHRSGRAGLPHPAPRAEGSRSRLLPAVVAVRRPRGFGPRRRSRRQILVAASPSLHRVPRVGSPASAVLRDAPTSRRPSPIASFSFAHGYHGVRAVRSPQRAAPRDEARRVGDAALRAPRVRPWRRRDLPGSWATPCARAPLEDPGETSAPSQFGASMLPSAVRIASALAKNTFRGSVTQPAHSLSTLRSGGRPCATQDSLPAGGQPLPGGSEYPPGCIARFQVIRSSILLAPRPGFAWRTLPRYSRDHSSSHRTSLVVRC